MAANFKAYSTLWRVSRLGKTGIGKSMVYSAFRLKGNDTFERISIRKTFSYHCLEVELGLFVRRLDQNFVYKKKDLFVLVQTHIH